VAEKQGKVRGNSTTGRPNSDLVKLLVAYAKQETLGPLRGLGRFVLFGALGAFSLSLGAGLLLLALLRALQTETGKTFAGNFSWAPYLITGVAAVLVLVGAAQRIAKGPAARRVQSGGSTAKGAGA
jgi:hypothetical protein